MTFGNISGPWKATVVSYDIHQDSKAKTYAAFNILVESGHQSWLISRRCHEIKGLCLQISKSYPCIRLKLPPRKLFGSHVNVDFLNQRRMCLDAIVKEIYQTASLQTEAFVMRFFSQSHEAVGLASVYSTSSEFSCCGEGCEAACQSTAGLPLPAHSEQDMPLCSLTSHRAPVASPLSPPSKHTSSIIRSVLMRTLSFFSRSKGGSTGSPLSVKSSRTAKGHAPGSDVVFTKEPHFNRKLTIHDFDLIKVIGKGSFGKVFLARFMYDNKMYAIKVISKSLIKEETDFRHIMSERNILTQDLDHPFLIKLKCTFQSDTKLYLVMQYVNGGELFFHLQHDFKFNEMRVKFYAAEIVSAFEFLHSRDIVYRDLKPENILLDAEGHVVLVDFGLAKEVFQMSTTSTFCGTPEYLAPEIILNHHYGKAVDWWCLGAVIYEMLVGLPPFYSKNRNEIFEKILYDDVQFPCHSMSPAAQDLIVKLLRRTPSMRLGSGSHGSRSVKSHPFFEGIDWAKIYHKKYQTPFVPALKTEYGLDNFDPEFLRESIPSSVLNEPRLETKERFFTASYPVSISDSTFRTCNGRGLPTSNPMSTFTSMNVEPAAPHAVVSELVFAGFSYANTIEIPSSARAAAAAAAAVTTTRRASTELVCT